MKTNQLAGWVAGIVFFTCSCQKGTNSGTPAEGQIFLTKYVNFQEAFGTPYVSEMFNYHYDNLDRLQSMVTYLASPPPGTLFIYPDSLIYYYNNADTLPYKALHYNNGTFTPAEYYTYDNQQRIIKQQYVRPIPPNIDVAYAYFQNKIIITNNVSANSDTLIYDGNNIIQDRNRFNIQFSGLQNPFYLVSINRHIPFHLFNQGLGELSLNKDATLQVIDNIYSNTLRYQYDSIVNGLPQKAITTINALPACREYFYYR
jgi:hypothetical protein